MTREKRNTAIEKNRIALLRLVKFWLFIAKLFISKREKLLPRRLGAFVSDQLYKAELAHYYLRVAIHRRWDIGIKPVLNNAPLNLRVVIARLKALKRALVKLKDWQSNQTKLRLSKRIRIAASSSHNSFLCAVHRKTTFVSGVAKCRAPPRTSNFKNRFKLRFRQAR